MATRNKKATLEPVAPASAGVPSGTHAFVVRETGERALDKLHGELKPIGEPRLVAVDGVHGVFTPVAKPEGDDAGSSHNLAKLVAALEREIVELRRENAGLAERLRAAEEQSKRTPDDFATAVAHSVDSLATRLSGMQNATSNFVVREFSLEAKVQVDVSPLGTIDYRFVQPGQPVDAARLSTLALKLAPVPKPDATGSFAAPAFTPQVAVEEIQGVGEVWGKRLNAHGIYTVGDLATAGARAKSRTELAALLAVDRERLGAWLTQAELMTVRDVDGRGAELLANSGVRDLAQLAEQKPDELAAKFNAENAKKAEGRAGELDAAKAARWIETARTWVGVRASDSREPEKKK